MGLHQQLRVGLHQQLRVSLYQQLRGGLHQQLRGGLHQQLRVTEDQPWNISLYQKLRAVHTPLLSPDGCTFWTLLPRNLLKTVSEPAPWEWSALGGSSLGAYVGSRADRPLQGLGREGHGEPCGQQAQGSTRSRNDETSTSQPPAEAASVRYYTKNLGRLGRGATRGGEGGPERGREGGDAPSRVGRAFSLPGGPGRPGWPGDPLGPPTQPDKTEEGRFNHCAHPASWHQTLLRSRASAVKT